MRHRPQRSRPTTRVARAFAWWLCGVTPLACSLDFDALDPRLGGSGGSDGGSGAGGEPMAEGGASGGEATGGQAATGGGSQGGAGASQSGGDGVGGAGTGGMGTGGTGGGELACTATYGMAPGYVFCAATATSCAFNADKGAGVSCSAVCVTFGGSCLEAYVNGAEGPCVIGGLLPCTNDMNSNDICVCTM